MKKNYWKRMMIAAICMLLLLLSGCQTQIPDKHFEGAGILIKYNTQDWRISKQEIKRKSSIITLFNPSTKALISVTTDKKVDADLFFEQLKLQYEEQKIKAEVSDQKEDNGKTIHTLSFEIKKPNKKNAATHIYAQIMSDEDNKVIVALAEYYEEGELAEITSILDDINFSDKKDTEGIFRTLKQDVSLAEVLEACLYGKKEESSEEDRGDQINPDQSNKAFRDVLGYNKLYEIDLESYDGTISQVLFPIIDDYDGEYLSHYNHGVNLYMYLSKSYEDSLSEQLEDSVSSQLEYYRSSSRDYQNIIVQEPVTVDDAVYQMFEYDYVSSDSTTSKYIKAYYIQKVDKNHAITFEIELNVNQFDGQTNELLAELSKAYQMPLDAYGINPEDLTLGGMAIDYTTENYVHNSSEVEVTAVEGYSMIGQTVISEKKNSFHVYVPRGKYTRHWDWWVRFDMYGVDGSYVLAENYWEQSLEEFATETLDSTFENHKAYSEYYDVVSEVEVLPDVVEGVVAAYFSEYVLDYYGTPHFTYHILIAQDLGNGYFTQLEIALNAQYFSKQSEELLQQYGELIEFDFSQFITGIHTEAEPSFISDSPGLSL